MDIARDDVERGIEARFIERGAAYAERGRVVFTEVSQGRVLAWVDGTRLYRVGLWRDAGSLWFRCSCPAFADLGSCQHVAAVIRALPDQLAGRYVPDAECQQRVIERGEVIAELVDLDREALVEILFAVAEDDDAILDAVAALAPTRLP